MARKPTPDLAAALAAMKRATGRGRGRKSEMYRWMDQRYDSLAAAFAKDPPSWTGLAKFFTDAGMLTADGLPQTPASVRSTWMRVSQTRTRRSGAQQAPTTLPHPTAPEPGPDDPSLHPEPPDDPPPRHTFQPAKIR